VTDNWQAFTADLLDPRPPRDRRRSDSVRTVYLEDHTFHIAGCPKLEEQMFPMTEEQALHDWPHARWHRCTWGPVVAY
jgi:hypothetical protein